MTNAMPFRSYGTATTATLVYPDPIDRGLDMLDEIFKTIMTPPPAAKTKNPRPLGNPAKSLSASKKASRLLQFALGAIIVPLSVFTSFSICGEQDYLAKEVSKLTSLDKVVNYVVNASSVDFTDLEKPESKTVHFNDVITQSSDQTISMLSNNEAESFEDSAVNVEDSSAVIFGKAEDSIAPAPTYQTVAQKALDNLNWDFVIHLNKEDITKPKGVIAWVKNLFSGNKTEKSTGYYGRVNPQARYS